MVKFNVASLLGDTSAQVLIKKQSDKSVVTRISLKDFIAENNIILNTCYLANIPVFVEYKSSDIIISMPGWAENPVDPELK